MGAFDEELSSIHTPSARSARLPTMDEQESGIRVREYEYDSRYLSLRYFSKHRRRKKARKLSGK